MISACSRRKLNETGASCPRSKHFMRANYKTIARCRLNVLKNSTFLCQEYAFVNPKFFAPHPLIRKDRPPPLLQGGEGMFVRAFRF